MTRLAPILIVCLASACCSVSPRQRAAASRLAAQAERVLPVVAQRLGVPLHPVKVELSNGELDYGRLGAVLDDRIVLSRSAADQPFTAYILAHEAVHIFLPDDLRMLPGAVQEGLADFIAVQVEPGAGAGRVRGLQKTLASGVRNGWGPAPVDAFALSIEQLYEMPDPFRHEFVYALGYAVASRLDLERLTQLCREAQAAGRKSVSTPFLCANAGLNDTTPMGWTIAVPDP